MSRRVPAPLLLVATVALAHGNGLRGAFQFDDFNVIVDAPGVHSLSAWVQGLGGLRPLLKLTYALNWAMDPAPWGFHLVNLAVHATAACLAFALLRRLPWAGAEPGDQAEAVAFGAALVWALHPVQTEAVTYLCGRSTSLMACLTLASLLAHLRGREAARPGPWRAASLLLFLLAALVKETALTLPAAVLLLEAVLRPEQGWRAGLRAAAPHAALAALLALGFLFLPGQRALLDASLALRPPLANLAVQVDAWTYLASAWMWPARLNIDPGLQAAGGWTAFRTLGALGFLGLALTGALALRRRPALAFALLWSLLHLLPTNSLLPRLDAVNERQLYLPGLGLAFLLATGAFALAEGLRLPARAAGGVLALLALGLGLLTVGRNRDYRSEVALWSSSVAANPANPRAHNNLGWAYRLTGERDRARACFRRALELDPAYATARANLEALEP